MELDELREHLLGMPGSHESMPFDDEVLAYKVGGKIFALSRVDWIPVRVNFKCDPERALDLREEYPEAVLPGYHCNKKHWNTLVVADLPRDLVVELCQHSWDLIVASLTRKAKAELDAELAAEGPWDAPVI